MDVKISFLGAGKMATALAIGIKKNHSQEQLLAYDISTSAMETFHCTTGIRTIANLSDAIDFADILLVAVKPQNFCELFNSIGHKASEKLIISIMAGIKISAIEKKSNALRIIRVMPNTPALVGKGVSAYATSKGIKQKDVAVAKAIFDSVGVSIQVEENMMDAVTAISGSGPAYVFEFIEALAKAGENIGLPYELALTLATETIEGSVSLLKNTTLSPGQLKKNVTSPNGTTAKALEVLSKKKFHEIICSAIVAAKKRSIELGRN